MFGSVLSSVLVALDAADARANVHAHLLLEAARSLAHQTDALIINCAPTTARTLASNARTLYLTAQNATISQRTNAPSLASLLCALSAKHDAVLVSNETYWHDIISRASAILNKPMLSNVHMPTTPIEFSRSVYAGKLVQHVKCEFPKPWLLSIDTTTRPPLAARRALTPKLQLVQHAVMQCCKPLKRELPKRTGLPTLHNAKIVIAGGKAFGSAELFNKYLQPLAALLNAAVGATRAAVDSGYAPTDYQIGQTGKIITPKLYIAFGISGSSHHMVGIKGAKLILAVNTDANAPITKLADYTINANMFELIPELMSWLPIQPILKAGTSVDGRPLTPCVSKA